MSELLKINVNDHTERKNGLTYLSWAWAWAEVLKIDPKASWAPHQWGPEVSAMPVLFLPDQSAMVAVTVIIKGHGQSCQLPVMDHRNKAIKNPDAFAINTAIMRCLAKAIAMHGLGLYIYAGEDLPEGDEPEKTDGVSKDLRASGPAEAFKSLQPEQQTLARKAAPKIDGAMPDINVVLERFDWWLSNFEQEDRNDATAAMFHLLDSKTRSAIKAAQKEIAK